MFLQWGKKGKYLGITFWIGAVVGDNFFRSENVKWNRTQTVVALLMNHILVAFWKQKKVQIAAGNQPTFYLTGLAGGECRAEGWKKVFIENDSSQQSNAILQKMSTHQYFDAYFLIR